MMKKLFEFKEAINAICHACMASIIERAVKIVCIMKNRNVMIYSIVRKTLEMN
jgi:hypothetical protein